MTVNELKQLLENLDDSKNVVIAVDNQLGRNSVCVLTVKNDDDKVTIIPAETVSCSKDIAYRNLINAVEDSCESNENCSECIARGMCHVKNR